MKLKIAQGLEFVIFKIKKGNIQQIIFFAIVGVVIILPLLFLRFVYEKIKRTGARRNERRR